MERLAAALPPPPTLAEAADRLEGAEALSGEKVAAAVVGVGVGVGVRRMRWWWWWWRGGGVYGVVGAVCG